MTHADLIKQGYTRGPGGSYDRPPATPRQTPKLEPTARHAPLVSQQTEGSNSQRFFVRVTSVRKRLLDEDNLCEKFHVDLCRYSGILLGDEADKTHIETTQRKTQKGEEEHTLIEVTHLPQANANHPPKSLSSQI